MSQFLSRLKKIPFPERTVLLALLLIVGSIWGFVEIGDEVVEKQSHAVDESILKAFRKPDNLQQPIGPPWVHEAMRDITALGSGTLITLVVVATLGFMWFRGKHSLMVLVFAAVVGGTLLSSSLKNWFDRDRPSVVPHLTTVTSQSFPSGHSILAAVTYLTLGALLARTTKNRYEKIFFLATATLLTLIIGLSRVYLGVHYPTDVLAGWCIGLAWASICVVTARWLQRRGAVEQADQSSGS